MPDYYKKLKQLLNELFQLNQPDLDFGFYRIMHAKAQQVKDFIDKDLLRIITEAFGQVDDTRKAQLQAAYENAVREAREEYNSPDPENTPKAKKAKAALDALNNSVSAESDIYDHLYRFFERYYDNGDFISRRYYARETSGRAAPFAIPYSGEEVKLHWANADQYYIKTAEHFNSYSINLRNSSPEEEGAPLRVHFRIVDATEGEHGNVKANDATKRFFIIHSKNPVDFLENGELAINFEYRPDPDKGGAQEGTWRDRRNGEAVVIILEKLQDLAKSDKRAAEYLRMLIIPAPTEKDRKRTILAKYVNQYTARNTMDYFIHKDLGGFLRRELDFYIKNEIMRLDDIENADVPAVESYLSRIKVFRKIAGKLIDFLAQLENFQKRLWLKKKFVIETNYCITLDRVPLELYPDIAVNGAQSDEWVKLFAIDEIEADTLGNPGFSKPLTVEFLKANNKLVLDTKFFSEDFKTRLIASIQDLDEQCDGLLIHSENFQALNLLQERFREQVKCVYIDPPYNTGNDGFTYKDSYQHSSWLSMLENRILKSTYLMALKSSFFTSIDDGEHHNLNTLLTKIFGFNNFVANIIWQKKFSPQNDAKWLSDNHDFIICYSKDKQNWRPNLLPRTDEHNERYQNPDNDPRGLWSSSGLDVRTYTSDYDYPITTPSGRIVNPPSGRCWRCGKEKFEELIKDNRIWFGENGNNVPRIKRFLSEVKDGITCLTIWEHKEVGHNQEATQELKSLGYSDFQSPKVVRLLKKIFTIGADYNSLILDYFAGSGTTAHAVINLNREDGGKRKYILVEMGDYFDTVLKPRIQKVIYSKDWKDGKPISREGSSHIFKYLRLESYEDTLNNLRFDENPARSKALESKPSLREDYMLRYMLNVESKGSQSLLNIDAFSDPNAYKLRVKKPGSDEYVIQNIDLIETFNYLIGLRVTHIAEPQFFNADFKREPDPDLPEDQNTKLITGGRIRQDNNGKWKFRKIEGKIPKDRFNPDNGQTDKVLIIWRNLTGDLEKDNLMLDEWFQKNRISALDFEFDIIYVNGSNNLPNLRQDNENWKVRLIEEEFMKRMWDVEGV